MFTKLLRWWEKLSAQTHNYISGYSSYVQKRFFSTLSHIISLLFPETLSPSGWERYRNRIVYTLQQPRMIFFAILLIIVDAIIIGIYIKFRPRWFLNRKKNLFANHIHSYQIFRIYRRILKWLGVKSLKNVSSLTLKEIATRYQKSNPSFYDYAIKVIDLYYAARFSPERDLTSVEKQILALMKAASEKSSAA